MAEKSLSFSLKSTHIHRHVEITRITNKMWMCIKGHAVCFDTDISRDVIVDTPHEDTPANQVLSLETDQTGFSIDMPEMQHILNE